MNILGISPSWGHDAGAAIVKNGRLVAAAEEERFTRNKHSYSQSARAYDWCSNSISFCLREAGITMDGVDAIAVPWQPALILKHKFKLRRAFALDFIAKVGQAIAGGHSRRQALRKQFRKPAGTLELEYFDRYLPVLKPYSNLPEISFIEHHKAHAATAYYCSGFRDATIVTIDGAGEEECTVSWSVNENRLVKRKAKKSDESLGYFYEMVTAHLNLGRNSEGKTMGLAPYGMPNPELRDKLRKFIDPESGEWYSGSVQPPYDDLTLMEDALGFAHRQKADDATKPPYSGLAFEAQNILEQSIVKVVRESVQSTGSGNVCLAGGVALNCSTNSILVNSDFTSDFFAFPASNDGGVPIGAALALAADMGEETNFRMEHAYWGPGFSDERVQAVLKSCGLRFEIVGDSPGTAAELIAAGKVIGWFQGRMEIGPRALGNRSILADPTRADVWERVNVVKNRELWRPLAPSLLYEAKGEYLEKPHESPFMILAFQVPEGKRKEIPAVVHVDGSTRPQTVKREVNEPYWKLIKSLESINGTPVVLNTSFNVGHEPIVCTPQDAIRTFYSSPIDALVIGNCVLKKS
ncbi:hypothetical protein HY995_00260 [Candidatus Micrarchaeota archaeon]|nr:hypothetical protein [Candidatus Micrarchaeota archaeon]